jgi:hypothetical protein
MDSKILADLATKIKAQRGRLCDFLGKTEMELMAAQTIVASVNNLETYGEAFSIKGRVNSTANNAWSYTEMLRLGYLREEERDLVDKGKVVVIFATKKLIYALQAYFE